MSRNAVIGCILVALVVAIIAIACNSKQATPAITYVYVIDYSKSTNGMRKQEVGHMLAELEDAPDNANVVIYRMGYETEEIFSGQLGDSGTDALLGTLKRDVVTSDPEEGTNFAKMTDALVGFSKNYKGPNYRLRIMTDGANDFLDAENLNAYYAGAAIIAKDQRIESLRFYGIQPEFRHDIRKAFGLAGAHLEILNQDQSLDN